MPRLSISYRRSDSADITGRIFDRLVGHYGKKSVFRDIDNVPIGVDFRAHIKDVLRKSDILLAVVGPDWCGATEGQSRIEEENDLVRIEVETALNEGIAVIPVLVGDARMPTAEELPESLKAFSYRNAISVDSGQDFDHHLDRLVRKTDQILAQKQPRKRRYLVAGAAAAALLLILGAVLYYVLRDPKLSEVPWLHAAYGELGEHEIAGPEDNPRILEYIAIVSPIRGIRDDGYGVDWAPAFVAWAFYQAGIEGPQSMDPLAWKDWGRATLEPKEGCVIVFTFTHGSHVGFYVGDEGEYVKTLGGNQDDTVKIKSYPKTAVVAYRLPPSTADASAGLADPPH